MFITPRLTVQQLLSVSVVALAIAGGVLGAVAVEPLAPMVAADSFVEPPERMRVVSVLVATAIMTTILLGAALSLGLRGGVDVRVRTSVACGVLGAANAPLSLGLGALLGTGNLATAGGAFLGGTLAAPLVGAPLGALYGLVAMFATHRLAALRARPTLTAHVAAQRTVGATVLLASVVGVLAAALFDLELTVWAPPLLGLVGAALFVTAALRARTLRRLAAHPDDAGLKRMPAAELGIDPASVLPLDEAVPVDATHVLVRVEAAAGGAYRRGEVRTPIARIA